MTTQIAVKLPDDLVERLDALVDAGRFPSRSSGVRRALETLLLAEERRRIDEGFRRGFADVPDDGVELAEAVRLAVESIEEEPWERWW
ncbi:MAG: ribbon-helix-helix domain-containing protein [Acidimicrobiales bacterium]|jgi:Arc/MetJ-type ribon-helix-helix transcriptional regulator|nr:ribbon-helix-helix domain-containing protein [Acidimicrobiales bacterium]